MSCSCILRIDAMLAQRNTRLSIPLVLGWEANAPTKVMIVTEQITTGRGKPKAVGMFASHCPFCGVPYEPQPAVKGSAT